MSKSNSSNHLSERESSQLRMIYAKVNADANKLVRFHGSRLNCNRGCSHCCQDEITVFEVEADWIRDNHAELLEQDLPGPHGMCAFLDEEGACRIYEHRPYVCRTQGLPLEWHEGFEEGQTLVYRSICPLNEAGTPLENLESDACWTLGSTEALLATEQSRRGLPLKRIALRDLFSRDTEAEVKPAWSEGFEV